MINKNSKTYHQFIQIMEFAGKNIEENIVRKINQKITEHVYAYFDIDNNQIIDNILAEKLKYYQIKMSFKFQKQKAIQRLK